MKNRATTAVRPPSSGMAHPAVAAFALEPRFMFDAAGAATGVEAAQDAAAQDAADAATAAPGPGDTDAPAQTGRVDGEALVKALAAHMPAEARGETAGRDLVIVDPSVPDYEKLLDALPQGADVVVLKDGATLADIAAALEGREGITGLHLITHGSPGTLTLGGEEITAGSVGSHADTLASIGAALAPEGDILLYGCDVAQGADGAALLTALAEATGADVAASDDATGAAAVGADWDLEVSVGQIESAAMAAPEYQGILNMALFKDINPNGNSWLQDFQVAGDKMFFIADDGTGKNLWVTDGTSAGTHAVDPSRAIADGLPDYRSAYMDGVFYFIAPKDGNGSGFVLWRSDGTAAGTSVIGPQGATNSAWTASKFLGVFNGNLYYEGIDDTTGRGLWKTDGTTAGTVLVKDPFVDALHDCSIDEGVVYNGNLYFAVYEGGAGHHKIWRTDGTAGGTKIVHDFGRSANPENFVVANNTLFFTAATDNNGSEELWKTNGTSAGTVLVKDITPGSTGSDPRYLTAVGNRIFFHAADYTSSTEREELWVSDGTSSGTHLVKDINPTAASHPSHLFAHDGLLYFTAYEPTHGREVWVSDGTEAGTRMLVDSKPGSDSGAGGGLVVHDGLVHFVASNGTTDTVWKTDGTPAGTEKIDNNGIRVLEFVSGLTSFDNKLFFGGIDNTHDREMFAIFKGPVVADLTINEDTRSGPITISTDGSPFLKVTGITGGKLYSDSSYTNEITNGSFIAAGATVTVYFDPTLHRNSENGGNGAFTVQGATSASDAGLTNSPATATITITPVNDKPVLFPGTFPNATAFVENSGAVAIDPNVTVADADNNGMAWATVSITNNFKASEDRLAFTNNNATLYGNIAASYNATTGVLTLTSAGGTASAAQFQNALRATTYNNTSETPDTSTRSVSFLVNDGVVDSFSAPALVTVAATNDVPVATLPSGQVTFTEGGTAVSPLAGATVTDLDHATLHSAAVAITANFQANADLLAFTNDDATTYGNIAGSYNATTGVLTLTSAGGTATLAQFQNALRAVTYTNTSEAPGTGLRTISVTANDGADTGDKATRQVKVVAVNDAPTATASTGAAAFVEDAGGAAIDPAITIGDLDNSTLTRAEVAITHSPKLTEDRLAFTNNDATAFGNIAGSYNATTGVLTLTSAGNTATVAQFQAALRAVTYDNTSNTPDEGSRTVTIRVHDGEAYSNGVSRTVTVAAVNDAPTVSMSSGAVNFTENGSAVFVDVNVSVADVDSATLSSAKVAITGNFQAGADVLKFFNYSPAQFGDITGSYDADKGVLTLTSASGATVEHFQNALRFVTFTNTSDAPGVGPRTVSVTVYDGTTDSAAAKRSITITAINDAPTLTTPSGGPTGYREGDAPVAVFPGINVADPDNPTLASVTVAITGNLQAGADVLQFTNTDSAAFGDITGQYDPNTGVLTLSSASGTATIAQYQAALRAVTYDNTSNSPSELPRTIAATIVDDEGLTQTLSRQLAVEDVVPTSSRSDNSGEPGAAPAPPLPPPLSGGLALSGSFGADAGSPVRSALVAGSGAIGDGQTAGLRSTVTGALGSLSPIDNAGRPVAESLLSARGDHSSAMAIDGGAGFMDAGASGTLETELREEGPLPGTAPLDGAPQRDGQDGDADASASDDEPGADARASAALNSLPVTDMASGTAAGMTAFTHQLAIARTSMTAGPAELAEALWRHRPGRAA